MKKAIVIMMILHEKLKNYELILGSKSPRRRELMAGAGLEFTLADYDVAEVYPENIPNCDVPVYLAELKSNGYPTKLTSSQILVTADTIVLLDDRIIGKPKDRKDAIAMVTALSGRRHTVITGVCIRSADQQMVFSTHSEVWFRTLHSDEIEYYVDTYNPMDKAGSYGIQEWIGYVGIERIEGSFYNVMGLPIQQLYVSLDKFTSK